MTYEFRPVRSAAAWQHLHRIRRSVLFPPGRHSVDYDENHPDDRAEGNVPFLLMCCGHPIGVVRLDFRDETAVIRLVAVTDDERGKGHGRELDRLIESEAKRRGVRWLQVNAVPEAVGYYEKTGWRHGQWDTSELAGIAEDCVQLSKEL